MDVVQSKKGRVRVGMTRYISALMLPNVLPQFCQQYPNIEIYLKELNSGELEELVGSRKLDFAIIHQDNPYMEVKKAAGDGCALRYQELFKDDFVVICDEKSGIGKNAKRLTGYSHPVLDLKELEGCRMIVENRKHRMRRAVDGIMKRANVEPKIILETELFVTAQRLVREGMGVSIINRQYLEFMDMSNCKIFSIPKKYKPYWTMTIVIPERGYLPAIAKEMIGMVRAYVNNWEKKHPKL